MPLSDDSVLSSAQMLEERKRQLDAWVKANYERVPFHERHMGTPLYELYAEYATNSPHCYVLGESEFVNVLNLLYVSGHWIECRRLGASGRALYYKLRYPLRKPSQMHEQVQVDTTSEAEPAEPPADYPEPIARPHEEHGAAV